MIRRKFLGLMTLAGASGVAALSAAGKVAQRETVVYKVQGFTCLTCATGLETLLGRENGIVAVKATYPEAIAAVTFDTNSTAEPQIASFIEDLGFKVQILRTNS